jgi:hypothetical protein
VSEVEELLLGASVELGVSDEGESFDVPAGSDWLDADDEVGSGEDSGAVDEVDSADVSWADDVVDSADVS